MTLMKTVRYKCFFRYFSVFLNFFMFIQNFLIFTPSDNIFSIHSLKPKPMRTCRPSFKTIFLMVASFLMVFTTGCKKNKGDQSTSNKTPLWVYHTHGDPYQSKPWVAGDKVIVCVDNDSLPTGKNVHCINRNTGDSVWKSEDTLMQSILSCPVVYNDLVILGGVNPHALYLNDGTHAWMYKDDLMDHSLYGNPLVVNDAVYFTSYISVTKHSASSGALVWETEGDSVIYYNLRNSRLVFSNGKLYFGDASLNRMTSFFESSGQVDWFLKYEGAFANMPAVTDNEIFIGVQDANINTKTLRCINLADQTEKWGVKLGTIFSDVVVAGDKVYAIGMTTLNCLSVTDGSILWQHLMSAGALSEPLVTGNKIFVGYGNGLLCLNATTGELLWEFKTAEGQNGMGFSSPTLDGDRIFVSCADGNVYCFSVN
jgi:outer membrane protein assembly factor BamB